MPPNSNSYHGNAAPIWPSMDSIMPPSLENGAPAGHAQAPNGHFSHHAPPAPEAQVPYRIEDTRLPGAPPLPVAGPTPSPNSGFGVLRGSAPTGARPGERAAALAARSGEPAQQVSPEISGASWNAPNALVPGAVSPAESSDESFILRAAQGENLVSMPNLNKVKLPKPTSIVKTVTDSVRPASGPVKAARPVEPEVANPVTSDPEVPVPRKEKPVAPEPEPVEDSFTNSTQLALQVIFGYEGDLSRQEVLDLAKGLEGVREVQLVGGPEAAAMKVLKDSAAKFGYGGENGLILRAGGYPVEYVGDQKVCLCVVLEQPILPKGTREKLTLIAREAARLG